ncbi:MAG: hypothetical protein A3G18_08315 [Rhodospirillales bacterium RIFCSPLOWO2_12_FULL_58_28]|nr:MAG: hypothetical protein A3H92_09620 [Rhodospirillales bacterium RIFCSPLOWO2_02_FULL_58_16]OHC79142.1 MAG: hypothetical protein A3G18_08315 [Rhodospirillales bacterium RIFCSPLOWO2_12_FULL_58_28]
MKPRRRGVFQRKPPKRETMIAYGHKSEIVNLNGPHRGGNDKFTNNPSPEGDAAPRPVTEPAS